jgi:perosamine synthetase
MGTDFIKVATPLVGEEEVEAVREVLLSGNYVSGKNVEKFEQAFAEYIGVKHAVAVNSGTAALHIALEALGVGRGDEVIVPPLTFFATVSSVLYLDAVPVFADIDLDDLCISPQDVEKKISSKTKAILPVHLFGAAAKMDQIRDLAVKNSVVVLEDCAQAHGTEYKGQKVGGVGDAGAFSFFATKHMTTGEGGMITTNDPMIAEQAKIIRNHGMQGRDDHVRLGFNNRMTELEAAIGLVQLKKLDAFNQRRIDNSEYILNQVRSLPWLTVPVTEDRIKHTYFWCPILIAEESGVSIDELKAYLTHSGIGFRQRYKFPLYRQPVLKSTDSCYADLFLPNIEKVAGKIIGLPNHAHLTDTEIKKVVRVLKDFAQNTK